MTTLAATSNGREPARRSSRLLDIGLWSTQLILAAMFLMAGFLKTTMPLDKLAPMLPWVATTPPLLVRFIGLSELAGALGLVLPALTRIKPGLTGLAAGGLMVVMLLASVFHALRGEVQMLPVPLVLGALAAFVAWGRSARLPIRARAAERSRP
jgi:uncharacterized membrane protein YphA (DoxX/SURF4 family)